jgi:hypothetical protein
MKHKRFAPALLCLLLVASSAHARQAPAAPQGAPVVDLARLREHVAHLASDRLEGRKTGTRGAEEAARYVAEEFRRLGLAPGDAGSTASGSGSSRAGGNYQSYLQTFPYVAGVELGGGNQLTATRRVTASTQGAPLAIDFRIGEDWMPLGFSSNARAAGPLVFVGYGITAAEQGHDDYREAGTAAGKVALAFSGTPDGDNPHGRFTRAGEVRFKAAAARAAGAVALVLVAAEDEFKNDRLSRLRFDNSGGEAGLPVAVVSRQAAARLLGLAGPQQLAELEKGMRASGGAGGASGQPATEAGDRQATSARRDEMARGVVLVVRTDVTRRSVPAANVVGVLEGSDAKLKHEYILVGAHYDHLGRGGAGSLAPREGDIHHGADDNASGTAALLELARLFAAERAKLRRGVVFVAFGGEEEGLLGSNYYVNHPAVPLERTVAMLNLDMVGRLRDGALNVGGVGTAAEWRATLEMVNAGWRVDLKAGRSEEAGGQGVDAGRPGEGSHRVIVTGANGETVATAVAGPRFQMRLNEDGLGPSDHASFYLKRVPVLFFFTGSHEDYHKPTDTADRVNYEGLASISSFVRDLIGEIQGRDERPTFTVAKVETNSRSTGFRVYLGTIPAYGDSADGLKLDGVREGSPAEQAGLRAGDLVVRLAGRDIRNVYDYTQALSGMKAGEEYEVEFVREGARRTVKLTPAARR